MLVEIQQNSDLTYRIYDFDRVDDKGVPRDLHIEESIDALNFTKQEDFKTNPAANWNKIDTLVNSDKFVTRRVCIDQSLTLNYTDHDSFRIFICTQGQGELRGDFDAMNLAAGDSLLIPASISQLSLETESSMEMLEIQIP